MKPWKSWIGEKVREARTQSGHTQGQLAEAIGVDDLTISKFERGRVTPSVETVEKIAQATGRPLEWFFASPGPQRTQEFLTIKGDRLWKSVQRLTVAIEEARLTLSALEELLPLSLRQEMEAKHRRGRPSKPGLWRNDIVAEPKNDSEF